MVSSLKRILIVDDDRDSLHNLSDILADKGYAIEIAADGASALEKISVAATRHPGHFDLCLLDFNMPGMDGAELYRKIRLQLPNLPAIMITAFRNNEETERGRAAGTWKVLHKPVDIPILLGLVDEATLNSSL